MKKTNKSKTDRTANKLEKIKSMISQLESLKTEALHYEKVYKKSLRKVHPDNLVSAKNLIHYRALRQHDLTKLQKELGNMGLPRLARIQTNVLTSLDITKSLLRTFQGKPPKLKRKGLSLIKANRLIRRNTKKMLGYRSKGRHTRIMVTLPVEAASNYDLVEQMIANGMNCARINCAHDSKEEWLNMIMNVRTASTKLGKRCKVAMDLGGPKIRTGALEPGPKVVKLRPAKDVRGKIVQPLQIILGNVYYRHQDLIMIPLVPDWRHKIGPDQTLYFRDARHKKRTIRIVKEGVQGLVAEVPKTTFLETGMRLFLNPSYSGEYVEIGALPMVESPILVHAGDFLRIDKEPIPGAGTQFDEQGKRTTIAHIHCTLPEVFNEVEDGDPILFDDGKIGGKIHKAERDHVIIQILRTPETGGKIYADKGINLPSSNLSLRGLTNKDRVDLEFVAQHADVINLSFVNARQDVKEFINALQELDAKPAIGVILKIETQRGFNQLTEILLEAMRLDNLGLMIARGDLAIETGWENMGWVQQEVLSICESAHVPSIWATQVLENLAKRGLPSRAEISDVVKAQQADCIMLNKGRYILQAIKFLGDVLIDLERYHEKSKRLTPALKPVRSLKQTEI